MARPRRQPRPDLIAPILGDRPLVPSTLRVQSIEKDIAGVVTERMGERLGVAPASALPADLKSVIATAAAAAAQRSVELCGSQPTSTKRSETSRGGRCWTKFRLARRPGANKGLDHIAGSNDVKQIMTRGGPRRLPRRKRRSKPRGSPPRKQWTSCSPTSLRAVTEALESWACSAMWSTPSVTRRGDVVDAVGDAIEEGADAVEDVVDAIGDVAEDAVDALGRAGRGRA